MIKVVCKICDKTIKEKASPLDYTNEVVCRACKRDLEIEAGVYTPRARPFRFSIDVPGEWMKDITKAYKRAKKSRSSWVRGLIGKELDLEDTIPPPKRKSRKAKKGAEDV